MNQTYQCLTTRTPLLLQQPVRNGHLLCDMARGRSREIIEYLQPLNNLIMFIAPGQIP
jgi:hypothetical protein